MSKLKIVIVDDTKEYRDLIKGFLKNDPELEIIGDFEIPFKLKQFIKESSQNHPDVVILDIGFNLASALNDNQMQKQEGLEFLAYLVDSYPKMKVIMFSYHNNVKQYVKEAILKGARGYISKRDGYKFDLKRAISSVTNRNNPRWFYKSPDIPDEWVEEAMQELRNKTKPLNELLTDTQLRVFLGISKGYSKADIISSKACSKSAFDAHTSNIRIKLGLDHNWQIPIYSIENRVSDVIEYFYKKGIKIT